MSDKEKKDMSEKEREREAYARSWLEAIGAQLAAERKRMGWSRAEMAERLGISARNLGYVENGENTNIMNIINHCHETGSDFFMIIARAKIVLQTSDATTADLMGLLTPKLTP